VSHILLKLLRGCLSHGTPLYRRIGYVWNAALGILYSAVNYSQYPHCSVHSSMVWTEYLKYYTDLTNPIPIILLFIHSIHLKSFLGH
jgi:hypothetical protein